MQLELDIHNDTHATCRCLGYCNYKDAWISAGKPTHLISNVVFDKNYKPLTNTEVKLLKYLKSKYCLSK